MLLTSMKIKATIRTGMIYNDEDMIQPKGNLPYIQYLNHRDINQRSLKLTKMLKATLQWATLPETCVSTSGCLLHSPIFALPKSHLPGQMRTKY